MSGRLAVIGIGPGNPDQWTAEARTEIAAASDLFGYESYLARVPKAAHQVHHASDNRVERSRAEAALSLAASGQQVAMISGGDPGVFAMAAAVCEAIDHGRADWRQLEVVFIPGVTAMLAVAARIGAPLGHDFCVLSLSDNLKPWALIERRLRAAADAGLIIALYNPISRARPWQLSAAFEVLGNYLPKQTVVIFGRAAGRPDEQITLTNLAAAADISADMATCVIIGSPQTRLIERPGKSPLVYSPRSVSVVSPAGSRPEDSQ
jgi:precorrin-3B C17-methyltransferase